MNCPFCNNDIIADDYCALSSSQITGYCYSCDVMYVFDSEKINFIHLNIWQHNIFIYPTHSILRISGKTVQTHLPLNWVFSNSILDFLAKLYHNRAFL